MIYFNETEETPEVPAEGATAGGEEIPETPAEETPEAPAEETPEAPAEEA